MSNENKRKYDSFRFRNGLTFFTVFVVFIIITVCCIFFVDDIYYIHTKKQLYRASQEISSLDINSENIFATLSDIEAAYDIYIEVYYPRDKLVYTSENNDSIYENGGIGNGNKTLKPRIMKILKHEDDSSDSYYETRQEYFATAKYIVYGTYLDNGSAIELYYSVDSMLSSARTTTILLIAIFGFIFMIFLFVIIIYTATFTVPLIKINNTTKKLAEMDFSAVCPSFRIRELNELSSSVNTLSESLDMAMKELRKNNRRLELEIEKQRLLEETRKQFIANASHELKTPIAIIQGYAEGLRYGITNSNTEEYCEIIMDEADKMSSLVCRLIDSTIYENIDFQPHFIDFSISEKVNELIEERRTVYEKKGITVRTNINRSFVTSSDPNLFERVFGNYFSNAVSHCDHEKLITVSCEQVGEFYRISVFNTGDIIADEDIEKIWNSFYRADKAHSRTENRFGLGLSIVSNVQRLLGAKYGVLNHENGVEFWFDVLMK